MASATITVTMDGGKTITVTDTSVIAVYDAASAAQLTQQAYRTMLLALGVDLTVPAEPLEGAPEEKAAPVPDPEPVAPPVPTVGPPEEGPAPASSGRNPRKA